MINAYHETAEKRGLPLKNCAQINACFFLVKKRLKVHKMKIMTRNGKKFIHNFLCVLFLISCPSVLQAHVVSGSGFASGLTHPLFGLDHLFAMVAVGILGVKIGGRAVYLLPMTFLCSMVCGLGSYFLPLWPTFVQIGISSSLLFFGLLVTLTKDIGFTATMCGVAFFAFLHGHSHGDEIFIVQNAAAYFLGLILMTGLLHVGGITLGVLGKKYFSVQKAIQLSGLAMCVAGVLFLLPYL